MRRRHPATRVAILLAAGALSALAPGCGDDEEPAAGRTEERVPSDAPGPAPPERPAADALRDLVQRRLAALQAGEPDALAATSASTRRVRDARSARNARDLHLRRLRVESLRVQTRGRRATLRLAASYGVSGVRGRWRWFQRLEATRTRRGWRVASVRTRRPRPPWEIAAYRTVAAPHFRVLVPDGVDTNAIALDETLERSYSVMRDRLPGSRLDRRYLVLIAADGEAARELTPDLRGVDQLTAVTDLTVRTAGPAQRVTDVVSLRLLVPWAAFSTLAADSRERVITHELTHAALAPRTSGRTPAWLQEAVALYVSGDRRVARARAAIAPPGTATVGPALSLRALATPDAIGRLEANGLSDAYAYSSAAGFYIAERYGERRLLALLASFNSERLPGPPGRALTDAAVRRTLGITLRRLERDLREWLRSGG